MTKKVTELIVLFVASTAIIFVISPFDLLSNEVSWWLYVTSPLIYLLCQLIAVMLIKRATLVQAFFVDVLGFLLASLIALPFADSFNFLLLYFATFLIMPLPVIAARVLLFVRQRIEEDNRSKTMESKNNSESSDPKIELINENGKVVFSLIGSAIICFEANDNYVITYYLDRDLRLRKSMDRTSLKHIEQLTTQSSIRFQRVHKSFLINPNFIERILGRSQAYKIKLQHLDDPIPVSRNFDISNLNT